MVHDFKQSLTKSNSPESHAFWWSGYTKFFGDSLSGMIFVGDLATQKQGIDRVLVFHNGRRVLTEEKLRSTRYQDVALEYESSPGKPGWIEKALEADFLAYAYMESRELFMFPMLLLQRVWHNCRDEWINKAKNKHGGFDLIKGKNSTYTSLSVAVPLFTLQNALTKAAYLRF